MPIETTEEILKERIKIEHTDNEKIPETGFPIIEKKEPGDMRKKGFAVLAGIYREGVEIRSTKSSIFYDKGWTTLHIICGERYNQVNPEQAYLEGEILDFKLNSKSAFGRVNRGMAFITKIDDFFYFPQVFSFHKDYLMTKRKLETFADFWAELHKQAQKPLSEEEMLDFAATMASMPLETDIRENENLKEMLNSNELVPKGKFLYTPNMKTKIFPEVVQIDWKNVDDLAWVTGGFHAPIELLEEDDKQTSYGLCKPFLRNTRKSGLYKFLKKEDLPERLKKFELSFDYAGLRWGEPLEV